MTLNEMLNLDIKKYRNEIIEAFTAYYGEEYKTIIEDRFDKIIFDFYYTPITIMDHIDRQISCFKKEIIEQFLSKEMIGDINQSISKWWNIFEDIDLFNNLDTFKFLVENKNNINLDELKETIKKNILDIIYELGSEYSVNNNNFNYFIDMLKENERNLKKINLIYKNFIKDKRTIIHQNIVYAKEEQMIRNYYNHCFLKYCVVKLELITYDDIKQLKKWGYFSGYHIFVDDDLSKIGKIKSFSNENMKKLISPDIPSEIKNSIIKDQDICLEYFKKKGKEIPHNITDIVSNLEKQYYFYQRRYFMYLSNEVKYLNERTKRIEDETKMSYYRMRTFDSSYLDERYIISRHFHAVNFEQNLRFSILMIPIIRLIGAQSFNQTVIHEMAHAIESSILPKQKIRKTGLKLSSYKFNFITEIHTEEVADFVLDYLITKGIEFIPQSNKSNGFYTPLFPLIDKFLCTNNKIIKECSIKEININKIFKYFNKEEIIELENVLSEYYTLNCSSITVNKESEAEYIRICNEIIDRYASKRKIFK